MRAPVLAAVAMVSTLAVAGASAAAASPYIDVRVSFKIIVDPANGNRPPTADGHPISDSDLAGMLATANDSLMSSWWRGYRFVLAEPPVEIGTPCSTCPGTNPSAWYHATLEDGTAQSLLVLENTAKANAVAFAWRSNAINLYINQGKGNGGVSSFPNAPGRSNDIVAFGATVVDPVFRPAFPGALVHHELGHYFDLPHTHNDQPDCPDTTAALCSGCGGGDDGIGDTLPDRACWTWLDIGHHYYGIAWADTPIQHAFVDDTYYNNMSYHGGGFPYGRFVLYRLTEGQLDRWTDTANGVRSQVRSGSTLFVSTSGSFFGNGSSADEFFFASQGIDHANGAGGDIVLLRPGTYTQNLTITKPVTLRATRRGAVRIGQ